MWRLLFPLFFVRLAGAFGLTLTQLVFFKLSIKKGLLINLFLTLVAVVLGLVYWQLPDVAVPESPALGLEVKLTDQLTPVPLAIEKNQAGEILAKYQASVSQQDFISQANYVNLAVLAHVAGQYELAANFLTSAKYIDPNLEFFTD